MSSSPNNSNFDLSSVFKVQSNYLSDIKSNNLQSATNSAQVATDVHNLQKQLLSTSKTYADANTSSGAVLSEQEKIISIIENEQARLDEKQVILDNALVLEQRKVMFTNTKRLQYTAYTKMMLVTVFGLCVHVVLRLFSGEDSNVFITLMHIANIIICGIIIMYMYVNMRSRSEINFNQLNIPPPFKDNSQTANAQPDFDNIFAGDGCIGDSCCGTGTQWDDSNTICIPLDESKSPQSDNFSTYNEIYNVSNDLLPCKLQYPYKDSATAQPNDNVTYMKSYQ
jgi:hypothetical protein